MDNVTQELNGVNYLLVDEMITASSGIDTVRRKCKKYNAILKGIKQVSSGGFFKNGYGIIEILIPVENINKWNDEALNERSLTRLLAGVMIARMFFK